jgi:nicotinamide riboside kinase
MNINQQTTVLVTGPESSGKSTLARNLSWSLDGLLVPEIARDYLSARDGKYGPEDLPHIWKAQKRVEDEARSTNASFVICDTGPEVIHIWAKVKFDLEIPEVLAATRRRHYDIILLCYPDIPWEPDALREAPHRYQREALFDEYHQLFAERQNVLISGDNRLETALKAIQQHSESTLNGKGGINLLEQDQTPQEIT